MESKLSPSLSFQTYFSTIIIIIPQFHYYTSTPRDFGAKTYFTTFTGRHPFSIDDRWRDVTNQSDVGGATEHLVSEGVNVSPSTTHS